MDFAITQKEEPMEWIVEAKSLSDFVDHNRYTIHTIPIIRCKDCKHHHYEKDIPYCDRIDYGYGYKDNDYCSLAERRTDDLQ